jgi:hypothetical protein
MAPVRSPQIGGSYSTGELRQTRSIVKTNIVAAMIVCLASSALAESNSTNTTIGSGLNGYVSDQLTFTVPQPPASLIRSGTRGTIKYFGSAPFFLPMAGRVGVDLNRDGTDDFSFGGGQLATASIPPSISSWFDIIGTGSNQFVVGGSFVRGYSFGSWIQGDLAETFGGVMWTNSEVPARVALFTSTFIGDSWHGPLQNAGICYIGVRFFAADGIHYGWIRVRLPAVTANLFQPSPPAVLDWAYEKRTNTPIRAGVISTLPQQNEFFVFLRDPAAPPGFGSSGDPGGFGSAFLSGNILRYEMYLTGMVTNIQLDRCAASIGKARSFPVLDFPRIQLVLECGRSGSGCVTDRTVFFGDVKLSALQIALLLRGQLCINAAGGTVIGHFNHASQLAPPEPAQQPPR